MPAGNHWSNSDVVDGLFLPGLLAIVLLLMLARYVGDVVIGMLARWSSVHRRRWRKTSWCQALSVSHSSSHDLARKAAQLAPCR